MNVLRSLFLAAALLGITAAQAEAEPTTSEVPPANTFCRSAVVYGEGKYLECFVIVGESLFTFTPQQITELGCKKYCDLDRPFEFLDLDLTFEPTYFGYLPDSLPGAPAPVLPSPVNPSPANPSPVAVPRHAVY